MTDFLVILALILVGGWFAGAEIAVLTVRKTRLLELVRRGRRGARAVQSLRDRPERFLATVQVGITVIAATSAAYGGDRLARRLTGVLAERGAGELAHTLAFAIVVALIAYLSLVLGELVPKSLALRHAERYAILAGPLLVAVAHLMRPLVQLLTASSNLILRLFGDRTTFTEARLSREELQELVEEAGKTGGIDRHSSEIAARAIGFDNVAAAERMVPRADIVGLPRDIPRDELHRVLVENGQTRMPVYEGSIDFIVGYVQLREALRVLDTPTLTLSDVMRPVHFVPETATAATVLSELQRRGTKLAMVLDEHGQTVGLLTVEDLLEELVGEILSETEPHPIRREGRAAIVEGWVPVREVNRALGTELPEEGPWNTLAGLVVALAQRIPHTGERVTAPDGTALEVDEATPVQVARIRVVPRPA